MDEQRELLKGNVQALILAVLRDTPLHGYAIAREIERRSGQTLGCGEGTLYPALRAMEREGLIAGRWETPPSGPARRVYAITEKGEAELRRRVGLWRRFAAAIDTVLEGGPHAEPA